MGDIGWMCVAFAMEWYYLNVYAIRLGATPVHLGILTSGRALLLAAGAGLAGWWQSRYSNAIRALDWPILAYRILLYFAIALVPFLPSYRVEALLILVLLSAIPNGICQGVFLGMLPSAVNKSDVAALVARRSILMNGLVLVCVFALGPFLDWIPRPLNYQIGFGVGFLLSLVSAWHVARVKTPDVVKVQKVVEKVNVWAYAPYRRFAVIVVAINMSVFMAVPLIQPRLVEQLNASDAWISLFGVCEMCAGAVFTLSLDRLQKRFSVRALIIVTAGATAFQTLILGLTPTLPPHLIGSLLFGIGWFAVNILLYKRFVELVPPEHIHHFAANFQLLANLSLFVGPLIGTFLIQNMLTIPAALVLIAGLRLGATFLAWVIRAEPQAQPT